MNANEPDKSKKLCVTLKAVCVCIEQERDQSVMKDLESEFFNGGEDFRNNLREYLNDFEDDGDLSYVETGRASDEPVHRSTLPPNVVNFNCEVSDDSDEEQDMVLRRLVLYGAKSGEFFNFFSV